MQIAELVEPIDPHISSKQNFIGNLRFDKTNVRMEFKKDMVVLGKLAHTD